MLVDSFWTMVIFDVGAIMGVARVKIGMVSYYGFFGRLLGEPMLFIPSVFNYNARFSCRKFPSSICWNTHHLCYWQWWFWPDIYNYPLLGKLCECIVGSLRNGRKDKRQFLCTQPNFNGPRSCMCIWKEYRRIIGHVTDNTCVLVVGRIWLQCSSCSSKFGNCEVKCVPGNPFYLSRRTEL